MRRHVRRSRGRSRRAATGGPPPPRHRRRLRPGHRPRPGAGGPGGGGPGLGAGPVRAARVPAGERSGARGGRHLHPALRPPRGRRSLPRSRPRRPHREAACRDDAGGAPHRRRGHPQPQPARRGRAVPPLPGRAGAPLGGSPRPHRQAAHLLLAGRVRVPGQVGVAQLPAAFRAGAGCSTAASTSPTCSATTSACSRARCSP